MIAGLKKIDSVGRHSVNETMLLRNSPGPGSRELVLERFRLPDPMERISQDVFHQMQDAERYVAIRFCALAQIFPKLLVEYGFSMGGPLKAKLPP